MTVQTRLSQQNISIVRWQLANSFCSSAYHTPLTVYPVLTEPNKNKYFSRCAFSSEYRNKTSWNRQQRALAGKRRIVLSRPDVACYSVRVDQKRTGMSLNFKDGIGTCFEILHFVVNKALCASVYKTFRLFKVGHVCIVLQRLQRAFSSVLLVVGNINHPRC